MYYSVLANVLTFHASILLLSLQFFFCTNAESQVLFYFYCSLTAMLLVSKLSSRNQHFEMTFECPAVRSLARSPTPVRNNRLCLC